MRTLVFICTAILLLAIAFALFGTGLEPGDLWQAFLQQPPQRHLLQPSTDIGLLHQRGIPFQRSQRLMLAMLQIETQMGFAGTPLQNTARCVRQTAGEGFHLLPFATGNAGMKTRRNSHQRLPGQRR